jgi:hypothetical protein
MVQRIKMMRGALSRFGRLFWDDLPLVNFAFFAVAIGSAERLILSPPRGDHCWTLYFLLGETFRLSGKPENELK